MPALAGGSHANHQTDAIASPKNPVVAASFDILAAHVHRKGNTVTFHMTTNGTAGADEPTTTGALGGAPVWSYVWPTSLDPSVVGFAQGAGILAMAATNHPDFDDTPLYDENLDGDLTNDGGVWHSHWVVLVPNEACGPGALAVKDIPEGAPPPAAGDMARPAAVDRQPWLHSGLRRPRGPHRCRGRRRGCGGFL